MSSNTRRPSLTTANADVQIHIMSFLSKRDLSALMRTCRYFLRACLQPLCSRSGALLHDISLEDVPSFRQFLRINAGPSSRAHLIKELWIAVGDTQYHFNKIIGDGSVVAVRRHWSRAFLDVLRHCHDLRRLRIDLWFDEDISFPLFAETISLLRHLEDLTLYLPQQLQYAEVDPLHKFSRLTALRHLTFLKFSEISPGLDHAPVPLEALPRSLVQLDIDVCTPVNNPFPAVRTLGLRVPTSDTFVANATAAFPNVTQLLLCRHVKANMGPSIYHPADPLVERARAHNKAQWQSQAHREAWPSLSSVWAVDLCVLYATGFAGRTVPSISIPFWTEGGDAYVSPVLADTSPAFLELRVAIDDLPLVPPADWRAHLGTSASSVVRLKLLFETEEYDRLWNDNLAEGLFDDLCAMFAAFTSVTHVFIKFAPRKTPYYPAVEWPPLFQGEAWAIEAAIRKYLPLFEQACGSLQWAAFDVYDLGLQCWETSAHDGSGQGPGGEEALGSWTQTSIMDGLAVLDREGMNTFRDVRQVLTTVWSR